MRRNYGNTAILVILLLVGLVIGGVIGQLLASFVPIINQGKTIGLSTTQLDLGIIDITFGINIHLSLAGALGLIIAILLYQRI